MAGPSRIKVSMDLQVSDLAMELQILVLCQISDDTMKTDFISFTRLFALGCKSTYSSQYVGSGAKNMSCINIDRKIVMLIRGVSSSDSGGLKMFQYRGS